MSELEAIGMIAGKGIYPQVFAHAARLGGVNRLVAAAFNEETDPLIEEITDEVSWMRVGQLSKMIKFFKANKITQAVMVGQISPKNLFDLRPDMRTLMLLGRLKERNAESIFNAIGEELSKDGIELMPATTFLDDLLPSAGHVCGPKPAKRLSEDAAFGFKIAKEIIVLPLSNFIPLTPEEFKPENNLNFSTGNLKHFPFDDESNISSSLVHNLTPIRESLASNLIANFPLSLNSLLPLLATSISLFFLTIPFFVAKVTNMFSQSLSSNGSGKKVDIFSSALKGSKFTIGLPLAFKLASGIS